MRLYPKMLRCWPARLVIALGFFLVGSDARAILVAIEYYDRAIVNPEWSGGPLWTGFVDTLTNTLTIEAWTELPLHGSEEFWIPRSLFPPPSVSAQPLVWPARNAAGGLYDVPESFEGHIDNTFAFISDVTLQDMLWKAPIFSEDTPPVFEGTVDVDFIANTGDIWPGWGGFALQQEVNGSIQKVFHTSNPSLLTNQPLFDERMMPALPINPFSAVSSSDATVTAVRFTPGTSPVPEARQWLAVPLVFAAALALRWFFQRRRVAA